MNQKIVTLNDGITMPQLGLGVWKAEDGDEVENAVKVALETGYRLIDTAAVYRNEEGVGNALKNSGVPREELFITTKLWNADQGARNVRPALEESLKKLQLDYIDLYLIHWPMPAKDLYVETWQEMEKLKAEGLIKSIGVCNFNVGHLEKLIESSHTVPSVNQIELHPYLPQNEIREYAKQHDIKVESWSPIGGSKGSLLDEPILTAIADKHGKSAAQIAIRWHLQNDLIVIPKSVTDSRIEENFDVFDFELDDDDMSRINSLENGKRQGPDPENMNVA